MRKTAYRVAAMLSGIYCVLLITTGVFKATAQTSVYHPFPDSNAVWNMECHVWPGCVSQPPFEYFSYTIAGDTVINSATYHKWFIPHVIYTDTCDTINKPGYMGAFRQDIPGKKVYYIKPGLFTEELLYDFDIGVGDTIKRCGNDLIVILQDSVLVGSDYRKKWVAATPWMLTLTLIEGIGGLNDLIDYCPYIDPPINNLTCFAQNGNIIYPANLPACNVISGISNPEVIGITGIFPNPFYSYATLETNDDFLNGALMIYNCFGQMVKQQAVISTKTVITRDVLKSGMYFYRLNGLNGQKANGRFVIAGKE